MSIGVLYYLLIFFTVFEFFVSKTLGYLNKTRWSTELPEGAEKIYDQEKYAKSMAYEKTKHSFGMLTSIVSFTLILVCIVTGLFGKFFDYLSAFGYGEIITTLLFFGIIGFVQTVIMLPFSYYSTFVIEEKFGFNKMTKKLFFVDTLKGLLVGAIIGGAILALLTFFYLQMGAHFWLLAWAFMTVFSVFMMMFYSSVIVPIFNKQTPLEQGSLRTKIEEFGMKVGFTIENIFVIDGSKRSTKANAYFSGFGPKKRIVLYDTLIADLTEEELVAVLAHEIGHYKKKHTAQMLVFSILQTGFMLFILGIALRFSEFSQALGSTGTSFALGMMSFGILFTPISMILGIISSVFSRKNEYEADAFAAENYKPRELKNALIKLSKKNLSNLNPHPAYEFFYYSHPLVLKRIAVLEQYIEKQPEGVLGKIKNMFKK